MKFFWNKKELSAPVLTVKEMPKIEEKVIYNHPIEVHEKNLNWASFTEQINMTSGFNNYISREQMKNLYRTEKILQVIINPIAKQFLTCKFMIADNEQNDSTLEFLRTSLSSQTVHMENIIDLYIHGNAYLAYMPTTRVFQRIDPCFVRAKKDNYYLISNSKDDATINIDDMIHFKMPSIFSSDFGDSVVEVALLNLMCDRYSYEFLNTFFIRGGNSTGIIETDTNDLNALNRLISSLRSSFSGRKNAFSDKVLPKGAKWSSSSQKLSEMQILEIIKANKRDLASLLGVPPIFFGDTDSVNYANSEIQMQIFYEQTILPIQALYCSALENNQRIKTLLGNNKIIIDNSNIKYLSQQDKIISQIPYLSSVLTQNEIRKLLGYEEIAVIETISVEPVSEALSMPPSESLKKKDLTLFENSEIEKLLNLELDAWTAKIANNPTWSMDNFNDWILTARKEKFLTSLNSLLLIKSVKYYKSIMSNIIRNIPKKSLPTDFTTSLVRRANDFLLGKIKNDASNNFDGYSATYTQRAFQFLITETQQNPTQSQADLSTKVRLVFGESYKSQANTIVRTEIGHALSLASEKATSDVQTYAKKAKKTWNSLLDSFTRDAHAAMNGEVIFWDENDKESLNNKRFSNGLRYPRDSAYGSADDVINCRCVLDIEILSIK